MNDIAKYKMACEVAVMEAWPISLHCLAETLGMTTEDVEDLVETMQPNVVKVHCVRGEWLCFPACVDRSQMLRGIFATRLQGKTMCLSEIVELVDGDPGATCRALARMPGVEKVAKGLYTIREVVV
jgi:hypothetical protein